MNDSSIKGNIHKLRVRAGLSQSEMARRMELSLTAYRKLESGSTRILNEHLSRFAEEAGATLDEVVNGFKPISSKETTLEDVKESYEYLLREEKDSHAAETKALRDEIQRLRDKLSDKEELLETTRKLLSHYEKELSGR